MSSYRRPSDDALRAALRGGIPTRAPDRLAERISRAVAGTEQRPARLALRWGLPLDNRAVTLLAALLALLLMLGILLAIGARRTPDAVSTYHGDAARTGVMPGPGPIGNPVVEWQVALGGPIRIQPAVVDGVVYVADGNGDVEARAEATGAALWSAHLPAAIGAALAVSGSFVYVGDESGAVSAFDTRTGARRWQVPTGGPIRAGPVVAGDLLLVGSMDAKLYALDPATGATRWTAAVPGPISRSIAVADGVIYVPTDGGSVEALDLSGRERWSLILGAGNLGTLTVANGTLYVPVGIDDATVRRSLAAVDLATRTVRWTFRSPANAMVFAGAVARGVVYAASYEDGRLFALDASTGSERWAVSTGGPNGSLAALVGSTVYVPSGDRTVIAIDASTGAVLWRLPVRGTPSALAVIDGRVILGTDLGLLVSISGTGSSAPSTGAANGSP